MKHSNLTPAWLDEATADEIADLEPALLSLLRSYLDEDREEWTRRAGKLEQGIAVRYGERAHAALAPKGQVGTIHLDDDGYDVAVEVSKTVKWDGDRLAELLDSMPEELARHLAKVKVEIDERKYLAAQPHIQEYLREARTVKPGKWKFTFKRREAGQEAA